MKARRYLYQDPWNEDRTWGVVKVVGGWYLRQYLFGSQINIDVRTTRHEIERTGIFDYELIAIDVAVE